MSTAHSPLGPSAAARWMTCTGSIRLIEEVYPDGVDDSSVYSIEGTRAHTRAEIEVSRSFKLRPSAELTARTREWAQETPEEQHEEMTEHAKSYRKLIRGFARRKSGQPAPMVLLEQRVDTGVEGVWGTADAIVLNGGDLYVVDYKYGTGVVVSAVENPQLKLYGAGAIKLIDSLLGDVAELVERVHLVVHQPRAGDEPSVWSTTVDDLLGWLESEVRPAAKVALSGEGPLVPSESACRWCPVRGVCRTRAEFTTKRDFGPPEVLQPEEIAQILADLPQIEAWVSDIKTQSLKMVLNDGIVLPGWKAVMSGGRRAITDHEAAIQALVDAGYEEEAVARRSAKTLGQLEKLVGGKGKLSAILGELVRKSEGKEVLVPQDDERPAIDSLEQAKQDFA